MTLDVRTLVVVLLVSAILMTATLALDLRKGEARGLARWNTGLALFAAGWLLAALRGMLPPFAGMALANALLLAGMCSQYAALLEFNGRAVPQWLVPVPAATLFVALLPLLERYALMTLVVSVVHAAALLALARVTAGLGPGVGPVRWLWAATLVAGAAGVLARAIDIWVDKASGMFTADLLHGLAFILLVAVTVTSSFAFLVMQRRRSEHHMRHIAMYDGLTALYNRRAFVEIAERELARAARASAPTAALMLDLDYFKKVNDQHGHVVGDRVLAQFAARLRATLRAGDVPGRYGGEEFCVLLPGTSADVARTVAERIRAAVAAVPLGGLAAATTVSIGVACAEDRTGGIDALLAAADRALYRAKKAGRNRVAAADPGKALAPLAA